jgi:hypothetical protein
MVSLVSNIQAATLIEYCAIVMVPPLARDDLYKDRGKAYQKASLTAASKRNTLVSGTNGLSQTSSHDSHNDCRDVSFNHGTPEICPIQL